jgi:DNA replication and repair protein RecF
VLQEIYIYQFRNLATTQLALNAKNVILVGPNGAGKSNFLEAIYYLCLASSFRERLDEHIVAWHKESFAIIGKHQIDNYYDKVSIQYTKDEKKVLINGVRLRDRKELLLRYPCVIFGYQDILMVAGEPALRRHFFDQVAALVLGDAYILLLRRYQQNLKQRNSAFKSASEPFILASAGDFASINWLIKQKRQQVMLQFNHKFQILASQLLQMSLSFSYKASVKGECESEIASYLESKRGYEWIKKSTLFGAHRDRYQLVLGDIDIVHSLSTGQKRMVSLLMKQVMCQLILEHQERKPIILLDDVFVELDRQHTEAFWQMLPAYEQIFMSELAGTQRTRTLQSCKVYAMEAGELQLIEEF